MRSSILSCIPFIPHLPCALNSHHIHASPPTPTRQRHLSVRFFIILPHRSHLHPSALPLAYPPPPFSSLARLSTSHPALDPSVTLLLVPPLHLESPRLPPRIFPHSHHTSCSSVHDQIPIFPPVARVKPSTISPLILLLSHPISAATSRTSMQIPIRVSGIYQDMDKMTMRLGMG